MQKFHYYLEAPAAAVDNRNFDDFMKMVEPLERAADVAEEHSSIDGGEHSIGLLLIEMLSH